MRDNFDRRKSLQELEQWDWGEPTYNSHLVTTCHRLRRKPLAEFSVEDLRIMIGQGNSLQYLLPLAFERLIDDPLAEGDFYRGDLLKAVLTSSEEHLTTDPACLQQLRAIVIRVQELLPSLDEIDRETVTTLLAELPSLLKG